MSDDLEGDLGAALAGAAPAGWAKITLTVKATVIAYDYALEIRLADGRNASMSLPDEVKAGFRELREQLYEPERGTWFSAVLTLESGATARFSYEFDEDPKWWPELHPTAFSRDLAAFPRADERIPPWLRAQLDEGDQLASEQEEPEA